MRRLALALSLLPMFAFAADPPAAPPLTVPTDLAGAIARCLHSGCTRDVDDQIYFKLVDLAQEADTKAKADAKATAVPPDAPKP